MDRTGASITGQGSGSVSWWSDGPMGENFTDGWQIGQRGQTQYSVVMCTSLTSQSFTAMWHMLYLKNIIESNQIMFISDS